MLMYDVVMLCLMTLKATEVDRKYCNRSVEIGLRFTPCEMQCRMLDRL